MAVAPVNVKDIELTKEERDELKKVAFNKFTAAVQREKHFWDMASVLSSLSMAGTLPRASSRCIFQELWNNTTEDYKISKAVALVTKRSRAAAAATVLDKTIIVEHDVEAATVLDKTITITHDAITHDVLNLGTPMCKKAGASEPPPTLKRQRLM
jgi:hypothetical protein